MPPPKGNPRLTVLSLNMCVFAPPGRNGITGVLAPLCFLFGTCVCLWLSLAPLHGWMQLAAALLLSPFVGFIATPFTAALTCALVIPVLGRSRWNDFKTERIDYLLSLPELEKVDVLLLQEVSSTVLSSKYPRYFIKQACARGFVHHAMPPLLPTLPAVFANSGLLIVSRHPIAETAFRAFKHRAPFDYFGVSRGALYAKVRVAATAQVDAAPLDVDVFNLHVMPAGRLFGSWVDYFQARLNRVYEGQISEIAGFVARHAGSGGTRQHSKGGLVPVVVAGDFNVAVPADGRRSLQDAPAWLQWRHKVAIRAMQPHKLPDRTRTGPGGTTLQGLPATFGHVSLETGESLEHVLTSWLLPNASLSEDLVFCSRPLHRLDIRPFMVPQTANLPFQFASDHSGLEFSFDID